MTKQALVVVSGDDYDHDLLSASSFLQKQGALAGFATSRVIGLNRFVRTRPVTADADVYVLYTSRGHFKTEDQEALRQAVRGGKGLVAIHMSNVMGDKQLVVGPDDEPFFDTLGNKYASHGPGAHSSRFMVQFVGGPHPVTAGLDDFELFDEHYEYDFHDGDVLVLAERTRDDGERIPLLYVREFGEGRVVYLALGHDLRAWGEPGFQQLVRQAIAWAGRLE